MGADSVVALAVQIPEPTELALRYYRGGNLLWAVHALLGLLLPALVLVTGWSARLQTWAERRTNGQRGPTLALYIVALVVLTSLLLLPLSFYEDYIREHAYGLSNQPLAKWLGDGAKGLVVACVIASLSGMLLYALLRKSPRRWWLWATGVAVPLLAFGTLVAPVWLDPMFNHYHPLSDRALESRILAEAARAGIAGGRVYEVDKSVDTEAISAYVTGFGPSKRIVLFDTMIRKLRPDELLFVVGHEMGHYVLGHVLLGLAGTWALVAASFYAVHRLSGRLLGRYGARFGFSRLDAPASIPLFLLLANAVSLAVTPVFLAGSRYLEHEADRFGLELTRDNYAAATAFIKLQQENLGVPRPGLFYRVWRASHPSLADRITFANEYRPWASGAPLVYGDRFAGD